MGAARGLIEAGGWGWKRVGLAALGDSAPAVLPQRQRAQSRLAGEQGQLYWLRRWPHATRTEGIPAKLHAAVEVVDREEYRLLHL